MSDMLLGLYLSPPSEIYEELAMLSLTQPRGLESRREAKLKNRSSLPWRVASPSRTPTLQNGSTMDHKKSRPISFRIALRRTGPIGNWMRPTPSSRKASRGVCGCCGIMGAQGEHSVSLALGGLSNCSIGQTWNIEADTLGALVIHRSF